MPVARRIGAAVHPTDALEQRLVDEWQEENGAAEPVIIEEAPTPRDMPNHLYVIWDDWAALSPLERSRVVMRAYRRVRGDDAALAVSIAMGLTFPEADNLRIDYAQTS